MISPSNNVYAVIPRAEVNNVNFDELLDTGADTLRCNNDNTKCIVKWVGSIPPSISAISYEGPYTHQEIKQILKTESWVAQNE